MNYKKFMESYYGGKHRSAAWHADGGGNDERHDLDTNKPTGTPHAVHVNGKKWKTFGSQSHAQNVANKIKGATVHKEEVEINEEHLVHVNDGSNYGDKPHPKDVEHVMAGAKKHNGEHDGNSDKGAFFKFKSHSDAQAFKKHVDSAPHKSVYADLNEGLDIIARADYKLNKAGKKSHKEIVFHNGSVDQEKDDELKREELNPSMGAGAYIKDFQKSDAPQFKGKSKEKKRMMGIAAYMAAKKDMKEEVENIEEAESHQSKTTMKHIPNASPALKKAAKDIKPGVSGYRDRIAMLKAGGVKEETVAEAKDEQEYGYEGDMAMTQLETAIRHATHLKDIMEPDTDLPEWVQSKITLATDYLQTACDYMTSEMNEALKGNQHKIDKNKNGKVDAHDFKLLRKEELDEALDPSEIAGNPKMYDAATAKKAYYHKSASASDKESLARHLDRHHGNTEWRKAVKEDLDEAMINGREYASHGLMHPDHAAHAVHKVTGSTIDFYAHGSGDKVSGKVTKNDGKAVHIKDTSGKTHQFKVQRGLPKQQNEQAPVAPVPDRKYIKGTPENKALKASRKPINGMPTKVKEDTNFDEEGNLMAEKKTYSQFVEQLLEYESDKDGVYRHTKGSYGKSYDSEDDDKPSKAEPSAVKRGRGRPAGAKSGANQKVSSGKSYGGIATHTLNLPK
jgi:hypothetical protein